MKLTRKWLVLLVGVLVLLWPGMARADMVEELAKQINELTRARELSEQATRPLESELQRLEGKLTGIERQVVQMGEELTTLEKSIKKREGDLAEQYQLLSVRVRSYYKRSRFLSPLTVFLSSGTASNLTRELMFRQAVADQDKQVIVGITKDLLGLEEIGRASCRE